MDGRLWQGRVNMLRPWLKGKFGGPVAKISLDAGYTCPNRDGSLGRGGCSYCPPGGSGPGGGGRDISSQLNEGLTRLKRKARLKAKPMPKVLAYFQAYTGTYGPAGIMAEQYETALSLPGVSGVIVSTRPDCLDEKRWQVLSDLSRRAFIWLELGLQSSHDKTLARINRGHDAACFSRAALEAHKRGIRLVAHVILGLPGESIEHTNQTAEYLAKLPTWGLKLHNLMVLKGSVLAKEALSGEFVPWERETWVRAAAGFLARTPDKVIMHRLVADPGRDELLMPGWAGDKDACLTALARYMVNHDISQGDLCRS
jgi:radical SAM protein (TIGR01212 family)